MNISWFRFKEISDCPAFVNWIEGDKSTNPNAFGALVILSLAARAGAAGNVAPS